MVDYVTQIEYKKNMRFYVYNNNILRIYKRFWNFLYRYNDISPLENHHCSIAFRLLEHPDCNIFKNFSKETFK